MNEMRVSWICSVSCAAITALLPLIPAQKIADPVTLDEFKKTFQLYESKSPGGCDQNEAKSGRNMQTYALQAFGDAYELVDAALYGIERTWSNYSGKLGRGLLFLLFGIEFNKDALTVEPASQVG